MGLFGKVLNWLENKLVPTGALSDTGIWDELAYSEFNVEPLTVEQVQPASIDLRLGSDFKKLVPDREWAGPNRLEKRVIDTADDTEPKYEEFEADKVVLEPGDCVLGTTKEYVNLPPHLLGEVEGRSSVGRLFVEVHKTAGIIDPGFEGCITLEIENCGTNPVVLHKGQRVCQVVITRLNKPAKEPYGMKEDSKYQRQEGAVASKLSEDGY